MPDFCPSADSAAASLLRTDVSLRASNTFGFDVRARFGATVHSEEALCTVLADPRVAGLPRLVLGGGSNLVLTRDVDGLALQIAIPGRRIVAQTDDTVFVEAGAGEVWHDFVAWTLEQGMPGLENLALIPGTVGASPVQNIGAYGLELADRFHSLRALDTATGEWHSFDLQACQFAYRDSFFKQAGRDRFIITAVTFALPKRWQAASGYADLAKRLAEQGITEPSARDIFEAVVSVRQMKLPDPAVTGNAGSFFKNPVVDAAHYAVLQNREPGLVAYPQADGRFKLAAGWMIDRCGWKGKALGRASVHERQALVLVNPGEATGADVLALAQAIVADVQARFGVALEVEPLIV